MPLLFHALLHTPMPLCPLLIHLFTHPLPKPPQHAIVTVFFIFSSPRNASTTRVPALFLSFFFFFQHMIDLTSAVFQVVVILTTNCWSVNTGLVCAFRPSQPHFRPAPPSLTSAASGIQRRKNYTSRVSLFFYFFLSMKGCCFIYLRTCVWCRLVTVCQGNVG